MPPHLWSPVSTAAACSWRPRSCAASGTSSRSAASARDVLAGHRRAPGPAGGPGPAPPRPRPAGGRPAHPRERGHARRLDPGPASGGGAGRGRRRRPWGGRQRRAAPSAGPGAPRDVDRQAAVGAAARRRPHPGPGPRGGHAAQTRTAGHFFGLTRNLSVNGMLLASPVRARRRARRRPRVQPARRRRALRRWAASCARRREVELALPGLRRRVPLRAARQPRGAARAGGPGGGLRAAARARGRLPPRHPLDDPPRGLGLRDPGAGPHDRVWHAEIRRAPRRSWRPGAAGPFYVVEGRSRESELREAKAFLGVIRMPAL